MACKLPQRQRLWSRPMTAPRSSLLNGVALGLVLGFFGAALTLAVIAWRTASFECELPGTEECLFETATAAYLAKLQAGGSLGCALVAGGAALALRRKRA
jgi:hypothetical protein